MFDMMRFQFGEIRTLNARLGGPNDFSVLVEFSSGMHATFVTSADASWFFPYERVEVFGKYSTIETAEIESMRYRLGLDAETVTAGFFWQIPIARRFGFEEEDPPVCRRRALRRRSAGHRFRWISRGGTGIAPATRAPLKRNPLKFETNQSLAECR